MAKSPSNKPFVPTLFPSWRFHPTETAKVVTEDQAAKLAPEWRNTPYPDVAPPSAAAPVADAAAPAVTPSEADAWYAAPTSVLTDVVAGIDDATALAAQRLVEEANPKGARKGVLKLIDARIAELTKQA